MPDLGRIGGRLLTDNLIRHGVDLAFDTDLLYLKVSPIILSESPIDGEEGDPNYDSTLPSSLYGTGIGINVDSPGYDLEINQNQFSADLIATETSYLDNITIATNTISTILGGINVIPNGPGAKALFDRLGSLDAFFQPAIYFDGNKLQSFSDKNIIFNPNGSGTIELQATTNITGDLNVTGDISISGNLSKQGNLILGDDIIDGEGNLAENDTVDFNVPFSQDLIPGADNSYDLGRDEDDSTSGRWSNAYIPDWTNIETIRPDRSIISDQLLIGETLNKIYAIQSNEDVVINPSTGITFIESLKWENDNISNLLDSAIVLDSTGNGYVKFQSTNGMIIPAGSNLDRPSSPELGDTRWNTDLNYLECFDGSVYVVATGGGIEVTTEIQENLANVYSLILG